MRRVGVAYLLLGLLVLLSACKAPTGGGGESLPTPEDEVVALLDQGKIDMAADVVADNDAYFAASCTESDVKSVLARLSGALDYRYSPVADEALEAVAAVEWPVSRARWRVTKDALETARNKLDGLAKVRLFSNSRYRPAACSKAMDAMAAKERAIRNEAGKAFAGYPLVTAEDFFDAYPVSLDPSSFLAENSSVWKQALAGFSADQMDAFLAIYGPSLPEAARTELSEKYFKSLCPEGKRASLEKILAAWAKCRAAGVDLPAIPGIKVAFLQVTSPDLIKDKAIDFPVNVKVDVPFEASKASMRQAFSHKAVRQADILVLMNVAVSKARRVVEENEVIKSSYVASYVKEENPEYAIARAELDAASEQYHAAQSKSTTSWAADILVHWVEESQKSSAIKETRKRFDDAKEKLRKTEKYNEVPNYQPYSVSRAHIDIHKLATVNYYIVDKRNKTFFRDTFDVRQKAYFSVCYDLQDSDPNREKLLSTSVLEQDVVDYETEPVVVNLSDLLGQYASNPTGRKRYSDMAAVHRAVARDRTTAQAKLKAESFGYDKYYDKRFDHVVVVRNLGRGLGSGFYVTEDMVLTNYHVVEENNYVQLKLFDDRETSGRVIARDARIDLALIQADLKQKPVSFYSKRTIPLGVTLEIIGHPNGLEYSITRGALSSIREMPPVQHSGSASKVRYIQTDAATNGGNSGGPVFYRNQVVGVLDWGYQHLTDGRNAQGLNFAIHYSEVFDFLERNGIRFHKGS